MKKGFIDKNTNIEENFFKQSQIAGQKLSKTGLLPCPFCGSIELSGITIDNEGEKIPITISCNECGATGPTLKGGTMKAIRTAWQIRAKQM